MSEYRFIKAYGWAGFGPCRSCGVGAGKPCVTFVEQPGYPAGRLAQTPHTGRLWREEAP